MTWMTLPVTAALAAILSSGCRTTRPPVAAHPDWLDEDHIESALAKQGRAIGQSSQAYSDQIHNLLRLQQEADVLFDLSDQENLETLASRVPSSYPNGRFPISDLQKYVSGNKSHHQIALVVIVSSDPFPLDEGKPGLTELIRRIDKVLLEGGVQRRVFESIGNTRYYKLDSAESD